MKIAMNAYVKGGIAAVIVIAGVLLWYRANVGLLPVNQSPAEFKIIDKMEKDGAQDFTLEKMNGQPLKLSDYKGKIIIVNFWASWCNPCVEEFPSMIKLVDKMKDDVMVIAVSTDDQKKDIEAFMKAFSIPRPGFEVVWDKDKSIMKAYGVEKVPESFLIGRDFKLIRKVLGIENWSSPDALAFFQTVIGSHPTPAPN